MKKTVVCLSLLLLSACAGLNLSPNPNVTPVDYQTLRENQETKKVVYSCSFDTVKYGYPTCTFVDRCSDEDEVCFGVSDLDYASFYISFNYQNVDVLVSDYIMNLAHSLGKDKKNIQKEYISELFNPVKRTFYDEDSKNMLFQKQVFANMKPSSFVTKIDQDISIFLSKRDIFLRNTIYPSLKLTGLKKNIKQQYLSESTLQYSIYPHSFDVNYSTEWIANYLGAPSIEKYENSQQVIFDYFRKLSKDKDIISDHSTKTLLESEKARVFVFQEKIKQAIKENTDPEAVFPSFPESFEGFANEYLPKYSLDKIMIIERNNNTEKVLKTFDKSLIAELLISNEDIAGFAYRATDTKPESTILIRFVHEAEEPRYNSPGILRLRQSGLESIYNKLRQTIVTDLEITKPYILTDIPYDCIKKVNVGDILTKMGVSDEEKKKYLSLFKNKKTKCIDYEEFIVKVIFTRDFR